MTQRKKNKQTNKQRLEANQRLIRAVQHLPEKPPAELQLILAEGLVCLSRQITSQNSS